MNKSFRRLFVMVVQMLIFATIANAIPAKKHFFKVKLEDGSTILVTKCGDESFHFLSNAEGTPVEMVSTDIYRLAPEKKASIAATWAERAALRNAHRLERAQKVQNQSRLHKAFGSPSSYTGKKKGVVILVNFSDMSMNAANNNAAYTAQFNEKGYSKNGHIGSVHDYFYDQSYGEFDLEFDVFGPVTVSRSYSYYGANDTNGDDKYPGVMVQEACKLANTQNTINWSDYDWDGDGEVDQVYVVYAGPGEHATENDNLLWPHESSLADEAKWGDGNGAITLGGAKINTYAISCELRSQGSSIMNGIGTACHEFCHCLGIPDMYDTSYSGTFGMNAWDLMDSGSYNGPSGYGEVPCGFTAYERWYAGWLNYEELNSPCYVKDMPALQDKPLAYIIYNDKNKNEYFILENRQSNKWFKYVDTKTGISGMLAYHVDYDRTSWLNNSVNSSSTHPRMQIIPAGGDFGTYYSSYGQYSPTTSQYGSMLFPGTKGITTLDNDSHSGQSKSSPYKAIGGKLFNKNTDGTYYMNKPITDIAMANGLISFTFMGGFAIDVPKPTTANVGNGSFTANWNAIDGAISYSLELTPIPASGSLDESTIVSESMSKMGKDGTTDIGSDLDEYMEYSGWTGSKVYINYNCIKLGNSSSAGYIAYSLKEAPVSGALTVAVKARYYNNDNSPLIVSLLSTSGNVIQEESIDLTSEDNMYVINFADVNSPCTVKISTKTGKKRVFVSSIGIYDGTFSADQFAASAKQRKASSKAEIIEGITGTSYTFTGLTENAYKYRVKAVTSEGESAWSDYVYVEGVCEAADETSIEAINTEGTTEYFTLNGVKVDRPTTSGIYLVKTGGKVQKKLIGR